MPTNAAVQIAIETKFVADWADGTVTLRFEEDPRKKPSGSFIRLVVRSLRSRNKGISGGKVLHRRDGWIAMQCFVEVGAGTQAARVMADAAIAIFEEQQFSGITCRGSEVQELGQDGKGFWQVNAKVFFDFDLEVTVG